MGNATRAKQQSVDQALQQLIANGDVLFDLRELRDFAERWIEEYPKGKATKAQVLTFADSMAPGGSHLPTVLERLIDALDLDNDGMLDFSEAARGFSILLRGGRSEKAQLLFATLDIHSKGFIDKEDLRSAFASQACTTRTAIWEEVSEIDCQQTAQAVLDVGDLDGDGRLSLDEFVKFLDEQPELRQYFSVADNLRVFNVPSMAWETRFKALEAIASSRELLLWPFPLRPSEAARVLVSVDGFSPVALGEFLGGKDPKDFSIKCAERFFAEMQLEGMTLDVALRHLSTRLCLPPEAQQIDRLISVFAGAYCQSNPTVFVDRDAAFLTAFAIVQLNTDAHNPHVRRKMTKEEFARRLEHVDQQMLYDIYDRVVAEEITLAPTVGRHGSVHSIALSLGALGRSEFATLMRGLNNPEAARITSSSKAAGSANIHCFGVAMAALACCGLLHCCCGV